MNGRKQRGFKFVIIFCRKNSLHKAGIPNLIISLYDMTH